jgi:hypothetical protein
MKTPSPKNEERYIGSRSSEAKSNKTLTKARKPCPRSLFETIKRFV